MLYYILYYIIFKNHRRFREQGNVHHLTSKLLKFDLVQTLNNFRNPSLRIVATGKASLVYYKNVMSLLALLWPEFYATYLLVMKLNFKLHR